LAHPLAQAVPQGVSLRMPDLRERAGACVITSTRGD